MGIIDKPKCIMLSSVADDAKSNDDHPNGIFVVVPSEWKSTFITNKTIFGMSCRSIITFFLYDDKMLITSNYKEGTKTITFDDVKQEVPNGTSCSDLDCCGAPSRSKQ